MNTLTISILMVLLALVDNAIKLTNMETLEWSKSVVILWLTVKGL
jgi:hypothetical protein